MKESEKNYGITLVALVITIVIMLILVGVTINIAFDGELFNKARESVNKTNAKVGELQKDVNYYSDKLNEFNTNTDTTEYDDVRISILQDWIALVQTAEGTLTETHSMLQRLNELAVRLTNRTNNETDVNYIIDEIEALLEEMNRISAETSYNNKKLLDGTFSGQVSVDNTTISIINCSAEALGLTNEELRTNLSTFEGAKDYVEKIQIAMTIISDTRTMLGANQNKFEKLISFFEAKTDIINTYKIDTERYIVKEELNAINNILQRSRELSEQGSNGTYSDDDRKHIQKEIKTNLETINIILNEEYNGTILLDGNHCGISKIDLEVLGIAEHASIVNPTAEDMQNMLQEYKTSIQIIKNEFSKL